MARARLLLGPRGGRFPASNCLLVEDHGAAVLVDTGCGWEVLGRVKDKITHVVYTHHHPDHISGHHIVKGRPTYSPMGEEPYRSLEDLGRRYASTRYREWMRMATTLIGVREVPDPAEYYKQGEDLCIRGICIKTVPAPGHLLSHTLLEPEPGWLHITDIDLTGFGPWYANPEASPLQFLSDIETAYWYDAECYTTSHKPDKYCGDDARSRLRRYALRMIESMETIYNAMEPGTLYRPEDLAGRGLMYRRYLPGYEDIMSYFETSLIGKLLPLLSLVGCAYSRRGLYARREGCSGIDEMRNRILDRLS